MEVSLNKVKEIATEIYDSLVLEAGDLQEGYVQLSREKWIQSAAEIIFERFPAEHGQGAQPGCESLEQKAQALLNEAETYIRQYGVGSDSRDLAVASMIVQKLKPAAPPEQPQGEPEPHQCCNFPDYEPCPSCAGDSAGLAGFVQVVGGLCFAHGEYKGTQCPKWPACATDPQIYKPEAAGLADQGAQPESGLSTEFLSGTQCERGDVVAATSPDCDCGAGNDAYLACHATTCALYKWAEPKCPHCGKGATAEPDFSNSLRTYDLAKDTDFSLDADQKRKAGDSAGLAERGEGPQKYSYSFYVYPDSANNSIPQDVFKLFEMINTRFEMDLVPVEFVRFRMNVESFGILLKEITRTISSIPEVVI